MPTLLITGGTGFVGSHTIVKALDLLDANWKIRTTVRNLKREADVRAMVKEGGAEAGDRLSFFAADLNSDDGWDKAVADCDFVLHVASPFPSSNSGDENAVIAPARDGTLRVLKAANNAGVKRVVLTSSFVAIGQGHRNFQGVFDETTWSDPDGPNVNAYFKSKIYAEKAAWDFVKESGGSIELAVLNPVGIFGPVLGTTSNTSLELISNMMSGKVPAAPKISFGVVDVRDVAELHIKAMQTPDAAGQRFLLVAEKEPISLIEISQILRKERPEETKQMPTRTIPDFVIRTLSYVVPLLREAVPFLGTQPLCSNEKAKQVLHWTPIPVKKTLVDTCDSLVKHNLV